MVLAERCAGIPTEEVERDIVDTEREIASMTQEADHLESTPPSSPEYKMAHIRASARRQGVQQRKEFVEKLRAVLTHRSEQENARNPYPPVANIGGDIVPL